MKLAKKFKKQIYPEPLPAGSPKISDLVKHYETSRAEKRKLEQPKREQAHSAKKQKTESNGAAKSNGKKREDSSSDSDEDIPPAKAAPKENSSSDGSSDDEIKKNIVTKATPIKPV